MSHVIAVTWNRLKCWIEDKHKHDPAVQKWSQRNLYIRMKNICLWSSIALTREMKVCMLSFPLPLIAYELVCHSTQKSSNTTNPNHHYKTKTWTMSEEVRWYVHSALNFITQGLELLQMLFEKNRSRKWKLDWKMNKKKLPATKLHKNRWIFFNLVEQIDGFIRKCELFVWSY